MRFVEEVPDALDGQRIDRVVAMVAGCSRAEAATWIDEGRVEVRGERVTVRSTHLAAGDSLVVDAPDAVDETPRADPTVEVPVVHADEDVIVVDKPAGLVVHPGAGHVDATMVNGLLAEFPEIAGVGDPARPGIVHRLDRGTSGLLAVARTQRAYDALVAALAAREVERRYDAVVHGHPDADRGLVDAPIGRSGRDATRMAVSRRGKQARTRYEVVARFTEPVHVARLACTLETGRTHQIRVHLSAIGHPVLGDGRYGGNPAGFALDRPFLHAASLGFTHPFTGEALTFTSPLPDDLQSVLESFSDPR